MALAKTTKDHDEIRKWAEARGGKPAVVAATESDHETGIIRLMFPNAPNHNDGALEEIEWDEWFEKFDASGLQLTYQEKTAGGQQSDFNKLVYPEVDSKAGKKLLSKSAAKKSPATKGAATKSASAKAAAKPVAKKGVAKQAAAKPVASKQAPAKAVKKAAVKQAPAKKTAVKKTVAKTAAKKVAAKSGAKSASKKSSPATPARNYPKSDLNSPTQVF